MHGANTFLLRQVLYCFLNFFPFFCHKHYWNYTSCRYHQHAPIKTHILQSVLLGWTCLNHFSASLSTFISFLCRPWEHKRVFLDTSWCKGVLFIVRSTTEAAPGLLLSTPTIAAPRQWLGERQALALDLLLTHPLIFMWSKVTTYVGLSFYRLAFDTQLIQSYRAFSDYDIGLAADSAWCTVTHW